MVSKVYDVIIVGTGPAGVTAANLLAGKGLDVLMVDRNTKQVLQLPELKQNSPLFALKA
jgi:2-polyprenyl-6-methoxyphenol hydroxylase-like FAD-dependent oxidoreductase